MKQFKDLKIGDIIYWAYSDGTLIETTSGETFPKGI